MDLSTRYLGLDLKHPIVASASPLTATMDGIRRLADAGASAIVMASIYEEQVTAEELALVELQEHGSETQAEASGYFPEVPGHRSVLEAQLELLRRASERAGVPVIASLNGASNAGWVDFARQMQQAGASAIELNIYRVPADPAETGSAVEDSYAEILRAVKAAVSVPVAVKLSPFFSSPGSVAIRLVEAGADGLVVFGRYYEPDIDLRSLTARSGLELSTPRDMRLPLLWTVLLSGKIDCSLAASGGVETHEEVVKFLLAGADAVMTGSSLLRHGAGHLRVLVKGLETWMDSRGFASVADLRGRMSAARRLADPAAFLRARYVKGLAGGLATVS